MLRISSERKVTRDRTDRFVAVRRETFGHPPTLVKENTESGPRLTAIDDAGTVVGPWRGEILDKRRFHRLGLLASADIWLDVQKRLEELNGKLTAIEMNLEKQEQLRMCFQEENAESELTSLSIELKRTRIFLCKAIRETEEKLMMDLAQVGVKIGYFETLDLADILKGFDSTTKAPTMIELFRAPSERLRRLQEKYLATAPLPVIPPKQVQ